MGRSARVGGLVRGVLRDLGLETRLLRHAAVALWPQIVGAQGAKNTRAVAVRGSVLHVAARTPAWAHNLTFLKAQLLQRLEEHLGGRVIEEIRFSSRGWQEPQPDPPPAAPGPRGTARKRPGKGEQPREARIEALAARIEDEGLRGSVSRAVSALLDLRARRAEEGWARCGVCGRIRRGRFECCGGNAGGSR